MEKSIITEKISPITYNVKTIDNMTWKKHIDQLNPCNLDLENNNNNVIVSEKSVIKPFSFSFSVKFVILASPRSRPRSNYTFLAYYNIIIIIF